MTTAPKELKKKPVKTKKISLTEDQLKELLDNERLEAIGYATDALMTCFALCYRKKDRYGQKRIMDRLNIIDAMMDDILEDRVTMEDYAAELDELTGVQFDGKQTKK